MNAEDTKRQLVALFLDEVQERARDLERNLLALESATEPAAWRELLQALLRTTHSLKGAAGLVELRPIETACHWMEELFSNAQRDGQQLDATKTGTLLETTDTIAEYGRCLRRDEHRSSARLEERLHDLANAMKAAVQRPSQSPGVSERHKQTRSTGKASGGEKVAPTPEHDLAETVQSAMVRTDDTDGSVRIAAEKLDSLLFRSGELLIPRSRSRTRVEQVASLQELTRHFRRRKFDRFGNHSRGDQTPREGFLQADEMLLNLENGLKNLAQDLADDSRIFERTAAALEGELHRARMQPVAQACRGLQRLVRDLTAAQGKSAELSVEGGDIEIDRSIIGGLQDALRHLVRNAVDHGLEPPEDREASGKPAVGRIVIAASLQGDQLQVRVEDDGKGIDVISLAANADRSRDHDEKELLRRIFLPGVSTSSIVTSLSGRGVGLEIVKNAVEKLRGSVEVATQRGSGTTFTLMLPLTLMTSRALLIVAGGQTFALDATSAQRLVRVAAKDLRSVNGRAVLSHAGRTLPVVDLAGWLGKPMQADVRSEASSPIIVVRSAGTEAAVLVDDVAGEQELLIRGLGPRLAKLRSFSGAAILPDGHVALLLNAAALMEVATESNFRHGSPLLADGQSSSSRTKKKILIVDDSITVRTLEKIILEAAGYEVLTASDGSEAWELLQMHGADAVVADVDMPRMDGFMLTESVRRSQRFKNLPVILITAREKPQDKARGLEAGADAYILKSTFDQRQLLEITRQILEEG